MRHSSLIIILIALLFSGKSSMAQLDILFFMKDRKKGVRDIEAIQKGNDATDHLLKARPDSAIALYRELLAEYPDHSRLYYHLAAAHADRARPYQVRTNLEKWLELEGARATCKCLRYSKHFKPYLGAVWMERLYMECWDLKDTSEVKGYTDLRMPKVADHIQYRSMIDQEILKRPRYFDFKNPEESDSLLLANYKKAIAPIDTSDLPRRADIGIATYNLMIMLRHLDHRPKLQVRMGEAMLKDSAKGYAVDQAAILIDEGMSNMDKPVRYGVYEAQTGEWDAFGDIEATNERRKAIGLEPIER